LVVRRNRTSAGAEFGAEYNGRAPNCNAARRDKRPEKGRNRGHSGGGRLAVQQSGR
jgi:hypothetical protein